MAVKTWPHTHDGHADLIERKTGTYEDCNRHKVTLRKRASLDVNSGFLSLQPRISYYPVMPLPRRSGEMFPQPQSQRRGKEFKCVTFGSARTAFKIFLLKSALQLTSDW